MFHSLARRLWSSSRHGKAQNRYPRNPRLWQLPHHWDSSSGLYLTSPSLCMVIVIRGSGGTPNSERSREILMSSAMSLSGTVFRMLRADCDEILMATPIKDRKSVV